MTCKVYGVWCVVHGAWATNDFFLEYARIREVLARGAKHRLIIIGEGANPVLHSNKAKGLKRPKGVKRHHLFEYSTRGDAISSIV